MPVMEKKVYSPGTGPSHETEVALCQGESQKLPLRMTPRFLRV